MSEEAVTIKDWLDAVVSSSKDLASTALGIDDFEVISIREDPAKDVESAFIALVGEQASVQIGVASSTEGCQQLARTLLAMEPDEEDLAEDEVTDAVGEVANIIAGQVKTEMAEKSISVNLGIPIFLHGHVKVTEEMELMIADVRMGSIPVSLLVLENHSGATPN